MDLGDYHSYRFSSITHYSIAWAKSTVQSINFNSQSTPSTPLILGNISSKLADLKQKNCMREAYKGGAMEHEECGRVSSLL